MIVDGRALAKEVLARARARAERLPHPPLVVAIVGKETPATLSYLKIKAARAKEAGCIFETRNLGASTDDVDAVIVQLPLPDGVNQKEVCDSIPLNKDADVLSSAARAKGELLPPVVGAIKEIFDTHHIQIKDKNAVVIGRGWLVGEPAATWLEKQGARVTILTSKSDMEGALKDADIVISGAGKPHVIKPEQLKQGAVLVDAGTSESDGTLAGDADPACAEVCSLFTPVPGGIGPVAVACLFENVVTLSEGSSIDNSRF